MFIELGGGLRFLLLGALGLGFLGFAFVDA